MQLRTEDVIRHVGTVESIGERKCVVRIMQSDACQGCAAHSLCASSESREKLVEASTGGRELRVGQRVTVEGALRLGIRAVYICYVIPLLVLVCVLVAGIQMFGEAMGAVVALASLSLYYAVLYFMRDNVGRSFRFRISDES